MKHPRTACAPGLSGQPAQTARPRNRHGKILFSRLRQSLLPAVLLTAFFSADASATDYYVDNLNGNNNNSGLSGAPWQDLVKVNAVMFQPGDNVYFKRGGTWTGTLYPKSGTTPATITQGSGTSPTNRVTFDAYGDPGEDKPEINGNGAPVAVQIINKQYFTFRNFHVTNIAPPNAENPNGNRIGIRVAFGGTGAPIGQVHQYKDVQILENDITDVWGYTARDYVYNNTGGIYVELMDYQGSQTQVDGLLIDKNYFADNRCIGLHVKAAENYLDREDLWATNLKISNNIFQGSGADHIVLNGAKGAVIEYNAAYDAGLDSLSEYDEETHIAGMWSAYHTRDITFQFNEVARTRNNNINNGRKGDSQAFDADLGTWGNHIFQYNYTHENEGGVLILMPDPTRSKVAYYRYNLSVNDGRKTNTACQFSMHPYPPLSYAYVYNNVFYSTKPEGFKLRDYAGAYYYNNVFHVTSAIYPTSPVFSNNAYYGHVPDVNDPYKVVADPKFVGTPALPPDNDGYTPANTEVFKLQANSPLINAGMNMPAPGDLLDNGGRDFWGATLYSGTGSRADIGAHEYVGGAAAAPAAVTFVDNPAGASVTYAGPWTHPANDINYYLSTKSMTSGVGAYTQHTFTGTNVGVYGAMGPNMGKVFLNLDSGASVLVDCYWPVPRHRVLLHQFTGLANVAHTLRATVMAKNPAATGNLVVIDYFQRDPVSPAALPIVTQIDAAPGTGKVYTGTWTHFTTDANATDLYYAKTRSVSATVGAYADFTFTGTAVRLLGTKGGAFGKINVSIDGGAITSVNCYQDILTEFQRTLFEAINLSPGTHTLRVTVATKDPASTANTIALDLIQAISPAGGTGPGGADIIKDNTDATGVVLTGAWSPSTSVPGFQGTNYVSSPTSATNNVLYTPTIVSAGTYEVFARWTQLANRATTVPYEITSASGTVTVSKDQTAQGSQWVSLGVFPFNAGTTGNVRIRATSSPGYTIADAVRFTQQQATPVDIVVDAADPAGVTTTGAWTPSTTTAGYYGANALNDNNTKSGTQTVRFTPNLPASGTYEVFAWWPAATNRSPSVPFKVTHASGNLTVNVDQRTNGSQWYSLGTYTFSAGTTGNVLITNAYTGPLPVPSQCYVIADAVRFVKQ